MRVCDVVKYLSPSSVNCMLTQPGEWYKRYVLREKMVPNMGMQCGTLFDHYCKTELGYIELREIPSLDVTTTALVRRVFESYKPHLLDHLLPTNRVILESTLTGELTDGTTRVPVLCKPDLMCGEDAEGMVRDWKTAGWSGKPVSPDPMYYWDSKTERSHKDWFGVMSPRTHKHWLQMSTYCKLTGRGWADIHWISPSRIAKYRWKNLDDPTDLYVTVWNTDIERIGMLR